MEPIVVDSSTMKALGGLIVPLILRDQAGRTWGYFQPNTPVPPELLEPLISLEELDRRGREGGRRTTAEILADLESRS